MDDLHLPVPNTDIDLVPGNIVKLGRFDAQSWIVKFGWYTWGGNRPVCGWYLINAEDVSTVKPIQLPDLYDIYLVESM